MSGGGGVGGDTNGEIWVRFPLEGLQKMYLISENRDIKEIVIVVEDLSEVPGS